MPNEIWHNFDESYTLYALIFRKSDDKVYNADEDAFETYTDADILEYDVPLTNHADSDYHSADFPTTIATGIYRVAVMWRIGGAIDADVDVPVAQGEMDWNYDTSSEVTPSVIINTLRGILNIYNESQ